MEIADNLVEGVVDDIILQKLCRNVKLDEKSSQICPLLKFRDPLQQPVEDRVDHLLAASH